LYNTILSQYFSMLDNIMQCLFFVQNVVCVCCVLIPKGQAAVKNTSRQNVRRSIQKRNQTANFSEL
jgi:hypothetical protein